MGTTGIWIHGCIDGYSRFLVYLEARLDKFSETVRGIYGARCNVLGWPSRVRGDRGKVSMFVSCRGSTWGLVWNRICLFVYMCTMVMSPTPFCTRLHIISPCLSKSHHFTMSETERETETGTQTDTEKETGTETETEKEKQRQCETQRQ